MVAKALARPSGVTRKMVPDRSPTSSAPSGANASPHGTPSSVANGCGSPSAVTRYTVPSNRLETYRRPSGPNAIDVAFTMPETNGSRVPSGRTRKIETGDCWPRWPLNVTYRLPAASNAGLSTWCSPVASGAAISTNAVSPGTPSIRTGVAPPSRPAGTSAVRRVGDA
jgi:hypothetical protein